MDTARTITVKPAEMVVVEACFVMLALSAVTAFGPGAINDWVCALAVLLSFMHAQKANGIAERCGRSEDEDATTGDLWRVYLAREGAWMTFFVLGRSWTALVGSVLFLAYPLWRRVGRQWVK
jgi:hypothetical protein